jgi:uncharacterized membrane protein YgaE (UPF0421/DUF939 family)
VAAPTRADGLTRLENLRVVASARIRTLRTVLVPLGVTAVAAGIAWALAHQVLGHPAPFFAPVAATIVLGLAPGRRSSRAVQMVIGVAVGIAIGSVLIRLIGSGAVQIALVVLLAMAASVLLGGGRLVTSQACSSAVLVAALPSTHAIPTRFVDALVGGFVGLACLIAVPRNPLLLVRRAGEGLFNELADTLDSVADSLAERDTGKGERALARAREATERAGQFRQALELADETVHIAPTYWRARDDVERYIEAARYVDGAVRTIRGLARASLTAIEADVSVPAALPSAIHGLATGWRELAAELNQGHGDMGGIETTLRAAANATLALDESRSLSVSMIVGQIRSNAVDLLRALGMERAHAVDYLRVATKRLRAEQEAHPKSAPTAAPD